MRRFGLRGNQEAARVLVQAMYDAGPPHSAYPGKARAAMREQRVDERPLEIAGRRMHDHSGRFVDDDQMRILEADIKRDRLRFRLGGFGCGQPHGDDLAGADALCRVAQHLSAIGAAASDASIEYQLLEAAAGHIGQMALQGTVETIASVLGSDPDLDPLSAE